MLAGTALGGSMMGVFGMTTLQCFIGGFETLASQSLGAGSGRQVGVWLWRTRIIMLIVFIPICLILCFFTVDILLFFQQEYMVAVYAQQYIQAFFPC